MKTGPFLLSSGRIKGVRCDVFLGRLLNLYIQQPSHPPSRSTTHPLSTRTLTCRGKILQPFLAASTNVPFQRCNSCTTTFFNVVTLARRVQTRVEGGGGGFFPPTRPRPRPEGADPWRPCPIRADGDVCSTEPPPRSWRSIKRRHHPQS